MNKVGLFQVEIFDLALRKQAAQAETQAMLVEIERIHRQASNPRLHQLPDRIGQQAKSRTGSRLSDVESV